MEILRTSRLILRTWAVSDVAEGFAIWGDPEVMSFVDSGNCLNLEQIANTIEAGIRHQKEFGYQHWAVVEYESKQLIGSCGFNQTGIFGEIELVFHFAKDFWGKGYATEAAKACIEYAIFKLKPSKIVAGCHPKNEASKKVLLNTGFKFMGNKWFDDTHCEEPFYELAISKSFSSISHTNLEICSPAPWQVYKELLLDGAIANNPEILDIGCGKGGVLAKAIKLLGGRGTGIDLKDSLANEPTSEAQKLKAGGMLKFVFEDADLYLKNLGSTFDLIICIGSSHAVGGPEQLLKMARALLKPNGKLLFAEIVWKTQPDQEFLNFLDCAETDQLYSPQLRSLAQKNGLLVQQAISCSPEDFESYELSLRNSMIAWCYENSKNPIAADFVKKSNSWWDAREKWARCTFGFEVILASLF